jgi:hypothetical protein
MTQRTDPEAHWIAHVAGPACAHAVVVGMLIGVVMCLSNLYVFFKTGWSMGVTITAGDPRVQCLFRTGKRPGHRARPLSLLENNALTTVASGAGYMTGGGNMAAYGALLMVTTVRPDTLPMVALVRGDRRARRVRGDPDQAPADQQGAARVPDRHGHGGDAQVDARDGRRRGRGEGASGGAQKALAGTALRGLFAALLTWCATRRPRGCRSTCPRVIGLPLQGRRIQDAALKWTMALKTRSCWSGRAR